MNDPVPTPEPPVPPPSPVAVGTRAAAVLENLALRPSASAPLDEERAGQRRRENLSRAQLPKRAVDWCRAKSAYAIAPWRDKLAAACSKMNSRGCLLGLFGLQSRGKTTLAVAAALRALDAGRTVRYVKGDRMAELYDAARQPGDTTELATEAAVTDWLCEPSLLVLDEIGKIRGTEYLTRKLYLVLDTRYDACRDTILIANLDAVAFSALLGNSVVERMKETGGLIACDWQGFRGDTP